MTREGPCIPLEPKSCRRVLLEQAGTAELAREGAGGKSTQGDSTPLHPQLGSLIGNTTGKMKKTQRKSASFTVAESRAV